jgi:hypothetical protein
MTFLKLLGYLFAFSLPVLVLVERGSHEWVCRIWRHLGEVIAKSHMERRHEVVDYIDRKWKNKTEFLSTLAFLLEYTVPLRHHKRTLKDDYMQYIGML